MKLFVVGLGTIGEPLARLFLRVMSELGIDEIIVHKNNPEIQYRGMLKRLHHFGAKLAVYPERETEFIKLLAPAGFGPDYIFEDALGRADIVIDCTAEKVGRMLKEKYYQRYAPKLLGIIGQGSEKGFGKRYAWDINDAALVVGVDKFLQVVSCNTHQLVRLIKTMAFDYGGARNFKSGRFYIGRRAGDVSQDESTIGVEVSPPTHDIYGTHQGEDAVGVFETLGIRNLDIHTSADKLNNPFMHVIDFDIVLRERVTAEEVERRFRSNPLVAVTYRLTNNQTFAAGRDWGHFGRILNQTVVCLPSLQVISGGREIRGRCFTPQDGNAILSSVAAVQWFTDPETYQQKVRENFYKLPFLFDEV